jgi:hypothetical protein
MQPKTLIQFHLVCDDKHRELAVSAIADGGGWARGTGESRMLRIIAWELFEWFFILAVLIGAVAGVAIYATIWITLLPIRFITPRAQPAAPAKA